MEIMILLLSTLFSTALVWCWENPEKVGNLFYFIFSSEDGEENE